MVRRCFDCTLTIQHKLHMREVPREGPHQSGGEVTCAGALSDWMESLCRGRSTRAGLEPLQPKCPEIECQPGGRE